MLLYDEEAHAYSDGWERIPSVTQVLSSFFRIDPRFYSPDAAARGTLAHELCAAYAAGDRSPLTNGYAKAFAQWAFDTGASVLKIEEMVEGSLGGRRYAGRYDLLAQVNGVPVLVDIKTGAKVPWHHAQVAAYSLVAKPARAMVLYVAEDGTYTPDWLTAGHMLKGASVFRRALMEWKNERTP